MKYTINIKNLKLNIIIGILQEERQKQQPVIVDCKIKYKKNDNFFIDYTQVVTIITEMLSNNKYFLIEDALEEITQKLKNTFKNIIFIKLEILKPKIVKNCTIGVKFSKKY